ncbi:hypothetical protein ACO1O0_005517 [Amphichorda felina]
MLQRRLQLLTRNALEVRLAKVIAFLIFSLVVLGLLYERSQIVSHVEGDHRPFSVSNLDIDHITQTASEYTSNPIHAPYKDQFWEVGKRLGAVAQWLSALDHLNRRSPARQQVLPAIEKVAIGVLPFLKYTSSETPLDDLRSSFEPGSRGIVIPVGGGEAAIRFAGHLISSLRLVLGCELPIQVAYAGDKDLPQRDRDRIAALEGARDVSFLDVLSLVDDSTLKLAEGGWAIKPFATVVSKFEQVIVLDADAVFLQKAEALFDQRAFIEHGALLFHDRLLWQHAFRDRHDWFKDQIKEPSPAMLDSLVWTEDYAEECDSGVVVLDKSRPEVLMGLLHTAWQNTLEVRDEVTYKLTYGDKESWWLGLELAGSGYAFEAHYGSILGWEQESEGETRVCSFVIAHVDDDDKLIWYNGSLLKNKLVDPDGYDVPESWMMDGKWHKGATKPDMSCMGGAAVTPLTGEEKKSLELSIQAAKRVDQSLAG